MAADPPQHRYGGHAGAGASARSRQGRHDEAFLRARIASASSAVRDYLLGAHDGIVKDAGLGGDLAACPAEPRLERARARAGRDTRSHGQCRLVAAARRSRRAAVLGGGDRWPRCSARSACPAAASASATARSTLMGSPHAAARRARCCRKARNAVKAFIPVRAHRRHAARSGRDVRLQRRVSAAIPHIRLVYWAGGNPFHHHQDLNRLCAPGTSPRPSSSTSRSGTRTRAWRISCCRQRRPLERDDIGFSTARSAPRRDEGRRARRPARRATTTRSSRTWPSASTARPRFTEGPRRSQWLRHLLR